MTSSIASVTLHYPGNNAPEAMAQERSRAVADLCAEGVLRYNGDNNPPYALDLAIENRQLVLKAVDGTGAVLPHLILSLSPYRGLIRDYFMMIESYERFRGEGRQEKLEPVDMARRGLHDEAADMMIGRLQDKITMDHATARRLFTLVCALHMDQARLWTGQ